MTFARSIPWTPSQKMRMCWTPSEISYFTEKFPPAAMEASVLWRGSGRNHVEQGSGAFRVPICVHKFDKEATRLLKAIDEAESTRIEPNPARKGSFPPCF